MRKIIREKEEAFKNSKHTATEERKYLEEIDKLTEALPLSEEKEEIHRKLNLLNESTKLPKENLKRLLDQRKALNAQISKINEKLKLNKEEDKGKSDEVIKAEKEKKRKECEGKRKKERSKEKKIERNT